MFQEELHQRKHQNIGTKANDKYKVDVHSV